jgi:ribosomal protein S27AE
LSLTEGARVLWARAFRLLLEVTDVADDVVRYWDKAGDGEGSAAVVMVRGEDGQLSLAGWVGEAGEPVSVSGIACPKCGYDKGGALDVPGHKLTCGRCGATSTV